MNVERWVAFATRPAGGNPAGVAVLDERPSDQVMQATAAEVGFSETAFLVPTGPHRWWTRYFAPTIPVPFCGHATVASAVALGTADPTLHDIVLETPVGDVPVALARSDGAIRATLTSVSPSVGALSDVVLDELLGTLGWGRDVLDEHLPPAVAAAGATHAVVALRSRGTLATMAYAFDDLRTLMEREGWTTVQLVHRERPTVVHARNPFPVGGVVEDPATGAAAAALGGYLRVRGELPDDGRFTIHQGVDLGRPSQLEVDASGTDGVRVTGAAVPMP